MRKSLIFIIFALVFLTPFILQADIYTTMQEIVNTMEGYVIFLEDSLNQEIVHFQADIIVEDGKSFSGLSMKAGHTVLLLLLIGG